MRDRHELLWDVHRGRLQESNPVALTVRCDWLTFAFKVRLRAEVLHGLADRLDKDQQERAAVQLGRHEFELRRLRGGSLKLANSDVVIIVDEKGTDGWTVQIEFSGQPMMRRTIDSAVDLARELAVEFGPQRGERVRRLDLCADIGWWSLALVEPDAWVKRSRARSQRISLEDVDKTERPTLHQHRTANVTGYVICPGNSLSAVVYDKREHLANKPEVRADEEARWRAAGWDGAAPVTRVEFRFRTDALHDMRSEYGVSMRDGLDAFRMHLDALWGYCAKKWLRLVFPRSADRLARCELDPAWEAVQRVMFRHRADPLLRRRTRAGATAAQAFGATLSHVAREQKAPPLREVITEHGEALDEAAQLDDLDDKSVAEMVVGRVREIFARAAESVLETFIADKGLRGAALFVLFREGAARARFASTGAAAARTLAA